VTADLLGPVIALFEVFDRGGWRFFLTDQEFRRSLGMVVAALVGVENA
jgi:hypothetical protein